MILWPAHGECRQWPGYKRKMIYEEPTSRVVKPGGVDAMYALHICSESQRRDEVNAIASGTIIRFGVERKGGNKVAAGSAD